MPITKEQETSAAFLIAEFNALQDNVNRLEEVKSTRVNFFLVIAAAVVAGSSGIIANPSLQASPLVTTSLASLLVFVLGIATLSQLAGYSIAIVRLHRRAGRIRRWFVNLDEGIVPHLAFEPVDDRPTMDLSSRFLAFRGGDAVVLIINSVCFAIFVVASISAYYSMLLWVFLPIAAVSVFLAWLMQQGLLHAMLKKAGRESERDVCFPYEEVLQSTGDARTAPNPSSSDGS